jgi:hypothetical protein
MELEDVVTVPAYAAHVEGAPSAAAEDADLTTVENQARLQRAAGILARAAIRLAARGKGGESRSPR